jgi:hypothetical protein
MKCPVGLQFLFFYVPVIHAAIGIQSVLLLKLQVNSIIVFILGEKEAG